MGKYYYWKLRLGGLATLLLLAAVSWALPPGQVLNGYSFQAQDGVYAPVSGGTPVPGLAADEATNRVPLGFTYAAAGKFYTEATVSSNGWLCLGTLRKYSPLPNAREFYQAAEGSWLAAPLWANLSGVGGQATYQTSGTAPNRVFVLEWRNWRWDAQASQAGISFQVRLYETTNQVEFSYQPEAGALSTASGQAGAVIGVYNSATGQLALGDASAAPTLYGAAPNILARPAAGQHYSFVPTAAVPCPAPLLARVAERRRDNVRVTWANAQVGGTFAVHYGPRGFADGSADDRLAAAQPTDTAQLTGLRVGVNYEFYVELNCGVGVPARSPRVTFFTRLVPSNDEGYRAQLLHSLPSPDPGTPGATFEATPSLPAGACGTGPEVVRDVWYLFAATSPRHVVQLSGAGTALEVRTGWSATAASLGCAVASNSNNGLVQLPLDNLVVGRFYFVRVFSQLPGTDGAQFKLALLDAGPPPANDVCAAATPLPAGQPYGTAPLAGSLQFATSTTGTVNFCAGITDSRPDVWYSFEGGADLEIYYLPAFNGQAEVLAGSCGALVPATGQSQCFGTVAGVPVRFRPQGLQAGARYYLRLNRTDQYVQPSRQDFLLGLTRLPLAPANDDCAGAVALLPGAPAQAGTVAAATPSAGLPPGTGCLGGPVATSASPEDVWYKFTAPATPVTLTLASDFAAQLEVRPGACGSLGASLACAIAQPARFGGANLAQPGQVLLRALTPGATYLVRVFGLVPGGMAGRDFTLALALVPAPPLNDEPATATVLALAPSAAPLLSAVAGNVAGATPSLAGSAQPDIWYKFVVPAYPAILRILNYTGLTIDIRRDAPAYPLWTSFASQINVPVYPYVYRPELNFSPGETCYVRISPNASDGQPPYPDFTIGLAPALTNDEPCGALPLPVSLSGACTQPVHGTVLGASFSEQVARLTAAINCTYTVNQPDVWYRFRASSPALTLHCDDGVVKLLRLFEAPATCTGDLVLVGCQAVADGSNTAIGTAFFDRLTVGKDYLLAVSDMDLFTPYQPEFTLCAEASATLPTQAAAAAAPGGAWPNPVEAGQPLTVQVPAGATLLQAEWLSAMGQRVAAPSQAVAVHNGQVELATTGRAPGLYLLRLWLPDGQPLPMRRIVVR